MVTNCENCTAQECFLKLQEYQRAKMPSLGAAAMELFNGAKE